MNSTIHMVLQDSFKSIRITATKSEEPSEDERAIMFANGLSTLLDKLDQLKCYTATDLTESFLSWVAQSETEMKAIQQMIEKIV